MTAIETPASEWGALAVSIPGSPAAWHRTEEFILVTGDGQHMAPDGTWWLPVANRAGLLSLDVDHPATAGCLLALLGAERWRIDLDYVGEWSFWVSGPPETHGTGHLIHVGESLGRACIAAAAALGKWPGGGA